MTDKKHEIDARDWVPVTELDGQILVNKVSGQLRMKGAAVRLEFPMLVVRHGETDGNKRYVLQGQVDGPENQLNRTGWKQARETACRVFTELENRLSRVRLLKLAEAKRMVVFTSPIQRAKETAEYFWQHFKERTGIELCQSEDDGLKEISFGQYDGCALEDIEDEQIVAMVKRYRNTQDATIDWMGTGESFLDVVKRAKLLLERLNKQQKNKLVVAFTHGTLISALRTALGDRSLLNNNGIVAFRDHIIGHAVLHWLDKSLEELENLTCTIR